MQVEAITPVSFTLHNNGQNKFSSRTNKTAQIPRSLPRGKIQAPQNVQSPKILPKAYNVSFNGLLTPADLIIKYLAARATNTSLKASRRMYLSLDKELENITTRINIPLNNGEKIEAFDINPKKSGKYLIYLHGFSQNITSNQPLYKSLVHKDFGILAIDYRGYGKNLPSKRTNENNLAEDVMAAAEYLKSKGIKNIGLVGHSFGSYVAAKVSNMNKFAFQVLISPMISLEFWLKNVIKHPKKYKNEIRMIKYVPFFKNQYSKVFNITGHLKSNQTPTYLVQSKSDKYIRTSKVNELAKIIPNLKNYVVLPWGGHSMNDGKIEAITNIIGDL